MPCGRHIPPAGAWIDARADNWPQVREQLHDRVWQVRRPERDRPVLVAQVDNGVVGVLAHGVARAELGAVLCDDLPCGGVLVFQVARVALGSVGVRGWSISRVREGLPRWRATSGKGETRVLRARCGT